MNEVGIFDFRDRTMARLHLDSRTRLAENFRILGSYEVKVLHCKVMRNYFIVGKRDDVLAVLEQIKGNLVSEQSIKQSLEEVTIPQKTKSATI